MSTLTVPVHLDDSVRHGLAVLQKTLPVTRIYLHGCHNSDIAALSITKWHFLNSVQSDDPRRGVENITELCVESTVSRIVAYNCIHVVNDEKNKRGYL